MSLTGYSPKITIVIPWDSRKNIGMSYNREMGKLQRDDDFCCFLDGDATFTTKFFGKQMEDIVMKYPECGLFTAMTNRVKCPWQLSGDAKTNDIEWHRNWGKRLYDNSYDKVTDVSKPKDNNLLSGVLILIRKRTWNRLGCFLPHGMLGIDNDIHSKAILKKEKVYLMNGVYVYHWYRNGDSKDKKHLLK